MLVNTLLKNYLRCNIIGKNSPKTTGKVIAQTVLHIIDNKNKFGVLYLSQLFDLKDYEIIIRGDFYG